MKSTVELEKDLLDQESRMQRQIMKYWFTKSLKNTAFMIVLNYVLFFFLLSQFNLYIPIPYMFFMESGLFFLIGGIIGTMKTSVTLSKVFNALTGANLRNDGEVHAKGTHSVITYSITGIILFILVIVTGLTWFHFLDFFV